MAVSVETLPGLERKVTVSVPSASIEEEVASRLLNLASRANVHGFRPGKAPLNLVKQRYADGVREEVAREMIQSTLYDALSANALIPAGTPVIDPGLVAANQDFTYTAQFEVFPEFTLNDLTAETLEVAECTVVDSDVDALIEKLREQNKEWQVVDRAVAPRDKLRINFTGFMDDQPMANAQETDYELTIGDERMIDGFETGLIGATLNTPLTLHITFPDTYHDTTVAGKPVRFDVVVTRIEEGVLPALDDAFAELFNVHDGGIPALKLDIKANMERELERRLNAMNRETIFDALRAVNPFDVPNALVEREIANLKHEMYHRVFGHEHSDNEKIPDFPRVLFESQAKRRVHMGLLFADYVKHHEIKVEPSRVEAMVDTLCKAYDDPASMRSWYTEKPERTAEVEALVMEELVAEKIVENITLIKKKMRYDEVMNPNQSIKTDDEEMKQDA